MHLKYTYFSLYAFDFTLIENNQSSRFMYCSRALYFFEEKTDFFVFCFIPEHIQWNEISLWDNQTDYISKR